MNEPRGWWLVLEILQTIGASLGIYAWAYITFRGLRGRNGEGNRRG